MPLNAFIRARRDEIVAEWERRVRQQPHCRDLPPDELRNSVPALLDGLARAIEEDHEPANLGRLHSLARYRAAEWDMRQVLFEYRELRQAIINCYARAGGPELAELGRSFATVHRLLDAAVAEAAATFHEQREQERELFLSILGHDLREPLNTIGLAATTLLSRDARQEVEGSLGTRAVNAVGRMGRLVSDLVDFARCRLPGGSLPVAPSEERLDAICARLVDEFRGGHPERTIDLRCEGDLSGRWDAARLEQALSNLLSNAVEHGGDPIEVIAQGDSGTSPVRVEVSSRGQLPPAELTRLFEPFRRSPGGGLGLGLFIVREVARAHGGDVGVRSERGRVTFSMRLARRANDRGAAA